jgi:hypothetical protein
MVLAPSNFGQPPESKIEKDALHVVIQNRTPKPVPLKTEALFRVSSSGSGIHPEVKSLSTKIRFSFRIICGPSNAILPQFNTRD